METNLPEIATDNPRAGYVWFVTAEPLDDRGFVERFVILAGHQSEAIARAQSMIYPKDGYVWLARRAELEDPHGQ